MTIHTTLIASSLIAASLISGAAQADLQGRDLDGNAATFEAYYDTDLDITWLANPNFMGAIMNGAMNWAAANTWAANLSFTDGVYVYDNWRLPITLQPDASCDDQSGGGSNGYNCTGSEMGHLFYSELGGTAGQEILTSTDPDVAKFSNLQGTAYWSATEYYAPGSNGAWLFGMGIGYQVAGLKTNGNYALAVSPGDVAAVPEAQTYALMLAGLGLIGWRARRRG